jgi:hypothetical protein
MFADIAWDGCGTKTVVAYYESVTVPYSFGTAGEEPR